MQRLWSQYRDHRRSEDRERLALHYLAVARRTIDRLPFQGSALLSREDLYGHAVVGLMEAIDTFDPDRGIRFETFAASRVRGAVLDALRTLDWVPRSLRRQQNDLRRAYDSLSKPLGRPPSNEEVCERMGWTVDDLREHIDRSLQSFTCSLDEPLSHGDEAGERRGAMVPDPRAEDPLELLLRSDRRRELGAAVAQLSKREQTVLQSYYFGGLTLKEIANEMGVSESRVCQIHTLAIRRLRHALGADILPA